MLRGVGLGEVQERVPWDDPGLAHLLGGRPGDPQEPGAAGIVERLRSYCSAIAVTANPDVVRAVRSLIPDIRVVPPVPSPGTHASMAPLHAALAVGGVLLPAVPPLEATASERAAARPFLDALPAGFLALHPGSGSLMKNWPAEHFKALARLLAPSARYLVVEGPADAAAVSAFDGDTTAVRARGLRLRSLGALLGEAGLYVGNDSGVTHLAAAFGVRTLGLFGPTDPEVWAPLGPRVMIVRAPNGALQDLDVATVAEAAAKRA